MTQRNHTTNELLLRRLCSRGATESDWREFYGQYQGLVARWCLRSGVNPEDLDDIFHDILVKLIDRLSQYDPNRGHSFRSWLKTVVQNALVDRLRAARNNPFPRLLTGSCLAGTQSPEQAEILQVVDGLADELTEQSTPAAQILCRCRAQVAPETWEAFVRREVLNEPVSAIAESLGIKKASVYQSVSRVRSLVRLQSRQYFDSVQDSESDAY